MASGYIFHSLSFIRTIKIILTSVPGFQTFLPLAQENTNLLKLHHKRIAPFFRLFCWFGGFLWDFALGFAFFYFPHQIRTVFSGHGIKNLQAPSCSELFGQFIRYFSDLSSCTGLPPIEMNQSSKYHHETFSNKSQTQLFIPSQHFLSLDCLC